MSESEKNLVDMSESEKNLIADASPRRKRPRDANQLAKLIVDIATGTVTDSPPPFNGDKDADAVTLGSLGGRKGGRARAKKLSPKRRSEIATLAAKARWRKSEAGQ